jgi:pimeloyl-ACP methyl ester carboxylesterase
MANPSITKFERASVEGAELEYVVCGDGEPVLLIHGSIIGDAFAPLLSQPSLAGSYRLVNYHRRGYLGSTHSTAPVSIAQQVADARALMNLLGIQKAHVVGHSFGGVVALQLALDAPEVVQTLALLEPALAVGASGQAYRESLANAMRRYREVGAAVVVDEFLQARWPGYRASLEKVLPGAFDQAVADAPTTFESELPGLLDWGFDEAQARRITQPVLSVLGSESDALWPRFGETHRTLCAWLPHAEAFILSGATHFLQVENPRDMAEGLARFFKSHPISGSA